ncbi:MULTISPECIES: heme biosynthesis protein HemY [unclassified Acinetobacter]|uniref:heme biosynthesis protein HemY n=1 Tax=unclassified Acinetobacter TaxID=196816 RepID=UPI001209D4A5|nr:MULTISPECIES: heme biosynthesis protein HemY [unclassified Acinetobacter]RZJ21780.1 MAG: heme biosynthesis protein HemY [Acinetobacter sp.]
MKQILLAYAFISLIIIAVLSLLSYGYGAGYVYLYWREWQIQTNIWMMFIILASLSLFIQLLWLLIKRYLTREQRKLETVFNFKNLHPYEQLAVVWLLEAAQDQHQFIQNVFSQSGLLKGIIGSRLYWMQQRYPQALAILNQSNAMAFELAEIQRIEIYLSQNDGEQALTHLEFLNQHELSPWLNEVKSAYDLRLTGLWEKFAVQFPWMYLRSTKYGHLGSENKREWLKQLLVNFDQANIESLQNLQQRYLDLQDQIYSRDYDIKVLWLKLLSRMPEMSQQHEALVLHLLDEQFNQDVFYLWFQQQLLKQNPDYLMLEQRIDYWENKYPSLPVFTFAKWHVYSATARTAEADQLLELYPDNVMMNYLRIKSTLKGQDDLIKQLNLIFENNSNFVEIKI